MTTIVLVGNPKPQSRTRAAAERLAHELTGSVADLVIELAEYGSALLDWQDAAVADLVSRAGRADVLIAASPTYKGTYTGLLKLFLDRIPGGGLAGVSAVPLMLGAGPGHALAPELSLRPVLTELGATVPGRGLYVLENEYDDPAAFSAWLDATRPLLASTIGVPA